MKDETRHALPPLHLLLALLVVAIWGTNFVVMHEALKQFPPITLAALRFVFASLPFLPLVRRPRVPVATMATYGALIGIGQFGLLFYAMAGHIAPGLASLLVQTQALFTVALTVFLDRERVFLGNWLALALCSIGVGIIGLHVGGDADLLGIVLVLGAAASWAGGNVLARRAGPIDMFALVIWSSVFAAPVLLASAFVIEGPVRVIGTIAEADSGGWMAVGWQAIANSIFGYGVWNWLLSRHPAAQVAPLSLMVPVFGMSASTIYLGEPLQPWKIAAALLVLFGLGGNMTRWRYRRQISGR